MWRIYKWKFLSSDAADDCTHRKLNTFCHLRGFRLSDTPSADHANLDVCQSTASDVRWDDDFDGLADDCWFCKLDLNFQNWFVWKFEKKLKIVILTRCREFLKSNWLIWTYAAFIDLESLLRSCEFDLIKLDIIYLFFISMPAWSSYVV